MIESFDSADKPDLGGFPSAIAQDSAPVDTVKPVPTGNYRFLRVVGQLFLVFSVIVLLVGGGFFLLLSRGPISNDQMRAQVESQLSDLLGEGQTAHIEGMKFALGKGGLLSFDARNVRILGDQKANLGVAADVFVAVKALPLLSGNVVVKKVTMQNASISLDAFVAADGVKNSGNWSDQVDFTKTLKALSGVLDQLAQGISDAGLEKLDLRDTKIVGFDRLGLRSRSARIIDLKFETDVRFQKGLFVQAVVEAEHGNWKIGGSWRQMDNGSKSLDLTMDGMDVRELLRNSDPDDPKSVYADSPFNVSVNMPFSKEGSPQQAVVNLLVEEGRMRMDIDHDSRFLGGRFNFRIIPEQNQIELEQSPVTFPGATAKLLGGLKFKKNVGDGEDAKNPIFELIANDVRATSLLPNAAPALAALRVNGSIDVDNKVVNADELTVTSKTGSANGSGAFGFAGETPSLKLDIKIASMDVDELKQLWHPVIAPKVRIWASDGIVGGKVRDAWVKADIPSGILGKFKEGSKLSNNQLAVHFPIVDAKVKTFGDLPQLNNATGVIDHTDMTSKIVLKNANVPLPGGRRVDVLSGLLDFGNFALKAIPASVNLTLKSTAAAAAQIGTYKALAFTSKLNMKPEDVTGSVSAKTKVAFNLEDGGVISGLDWSADVAVSKFSSKKKISGRQFNDANLKIVATPKSAKVSGTANVDGVNAKIALVERFDGRGAGGERSMSLTLSDADRRKLGFDTDDIIRGPVSVSISEGKDGTQLVEADLTKAKLSIPWIKWTKGSGIKARARFTYSSSKGAQRLSNFKLSGAGFHASGDIVLDKNGLVKVGLSDVRLNKADRLAVNANRTKGGFDIKIKAKSYDGRAIIQTFLQNDQSNPVSKTKRTVTVSGTINKLIGFGGQSLTGVSLDYVQKNGRVQRADVRALAANNAPTSFSINTTAEGKRTRVSTINAGSVLRFLDIYSKVRGGQLKVDLVKGRSNAYVGQVAATNFFLLDEPRLGQLLQPPGKGGARDRDGNAAIRKVAKLDPRKVKIQTLTANVTMRNNFLSVKNGRIKGGDAGAAFDGQIYDQNDRLVIKGTFLPAYGLNRLVSKIPILGLALGGGKKDGLIGITFKLYGPYKNPKLLVNPVSLLTPGVFRKIFEF